MKAFITSGLCLSLAWFASTAGAQEWRAVNPGSLPVAIGKPASTAGSLRPVSDAGPVVIRGQAPDDKTPSPFKIEVLEQPDPKSTQQVPKQKVFTPIQPDPKDKGFTPPPPREMPTPLFSNLGVGCDGGPCEVGCGRCCWLPWGPDCPDRPRIWGSAEYMLWWQRAQSVPPLVTSSPNATTPAIDAGKLGLASTTILYNDIPDPMRSGARFGLGLWVPRFCNLGLEGNFLFLGRTSSNTTFSSNGDPQLSRPYINQNGDPQAEHFAINRPGDPAPFNQVASGFANINTFSSAWGAEMNLRARLACRECWWMDLLVGYRYFNLSEGIDITEVAQTPPPVPILITEREGFHTRNQFHGGQIGLDTEYRLWNRFSIGVNGKVAFGVVHQTVDITGTTNFVNPAGFPIPSNTQTGALLALPSNIGHHSRSRFAVMPEVGVKLGYDVTEHLRVYVGYQFIYLSSVVRPGEQIDLRVNSLNRPSNGFAAKNNAPQLPAVLFRTSDYWAQGVSFGMLYRY